MHARGRDIVLVLAGCVQGEHAKADHRYFVKWYVKCREANVRFQVNLLRNDFILWNSLKKLNFWIIS